MTIKEVVNARRINLTVKRTGTWLQLLSMNGHDSRTQQLTCTKL